MSNNEISSKGINSRKNKRQKNMKYILLGMALAFAMYLSDKYIF